jgi:hypothetical protein
MVTINASFQKLLLLTLVLPIVGLDIGAISSGSSLAAVGIPLAPVFCRRQATGVY